MQQPQPQFNQDKGSSSGSSINSKMEKFMDVMSEGKVLWVDNEIAEFKIFHCMQHLHQHISQTCP